VQLPERVAGGLAVQREGHDAHGRLHVFLRIRHPTPDGYELSSTRHRYQDLLDDIQSMDTENLPSAQHQTHVTFTHTTQPNVWYEAFADKNLVSKVY
jgi:hypothetical protein